MAMFTFSVFINRPQKEVFDFLSRPEYIRQPTALMHVAAWTSHDGPGIGSTCRGITKTVGQDAELQPAITQWDPPRRYGIRIPNVQFPFECTEYLYTLEPEDGGTRLTLVSEVQWANSH